MKDPCWDYVKQLHGNKVRCTFCHKEMQGHLRRVKHHLAKISGKGVTVCPSVPDDVRLKVQLMIPETATTDAASVAPVIISDTHSQNPQEIAEKSVSRFFFDNGIDIGIASSASYRHMIEAIAKCGPGFVAPTPVSLKTEWLGKIKSEFRLELQKSKQKWVNTGCTLIVEGGTDNKSQAYINFFVASQSKTFFLQSVNASSYYKNPDRLADLIRSTVEDLGKGNVVQIISDTSFSESAVKSYINETNGSIFTSRCASVCSNQILEIFSKVEWVKDCILQAQGISRAVYNDRSMLDLMKKFTNGKDIVKSGVTKPVSDFLSLKSLMEHKTEIDQMLTSMDRAVENRFWGWLEDSVALSEPILELLRAIYGGKVDAGEIYSSVARAKQAINIYFEKDKEKQKQFSEIITRQYCHLLSPLYGAAAFLNPSIQYTMKKENLTYLKNDLFKLVNQLYSDRAAEITKELATFTNSEGMFENELAKVTRDTVPPYTWWGQFGDSTPALQLVAVRLLSQVCSCSSLQREWRTFQQMHQGRQNKIDEEIQVDLVYVSQNLKLERMTKSNPIALEEIDMMSEWVKKKGDTSTWDSSQI